MEILIATHNKAKFKMYKRILDKYGFVSYSLDDINITDEVKEEGTTPLENAISKVKGYSKITKLPIVSVDDGLDIDNIPKSLNPGVNVRRVNGKRLTDKEMITHYTNLAKKYGDNEKLTARFVKGIAISVNNIIHCCQFNREIIISSTAVDEMIEGYPMNSITLDPKYKKYTINLTEEEKEEIDKRYYFEFENLIKKVFNI